MFEVISTGLGATLQDLGRRGWRRYGVPPSGAMDDHAAGWANRLLDNAPTSPVVELLWQGARLKALQQVWVAATGAEADGSIPMWRAVRIGSSDLVQFPRVRAGLWIYLAVAGGFEAPRLLGSASVYARGKLGVPLAPGDRLHGSSSFELPSGVAGRFVAAKDRRDYLSPPPLRVWPGPQWDLFDEEERARFLTSEWHVTSQSDRVGYRLAGPQLKPDVSQIVSEPVRVGSIQLPESGQPIVTMRDGPTLGGYPKLGMVDPADLSWLAQCAPGQPIRFQLVHAA